MWEYTVNVALIPLTPNEALTQFTFQPYMYSQEHTLIPLTPIEAFTNFSSLTYSQEHTKGCSGSQKAGVGVEHLQVGLHAREPDRCSRKQINAGRKAMDG